VSPGPESPGGRWESFDLLRALRPFCTLNPLRALRLLRTFGFLGTLDSLRAIRRGYAVAAPIVRPALRPIRSALGLTVVALLPDSVLRLRALRRTREITRTLHCVGGQTPIPAEFRPHPLAVGVKPFDPYAIEAGLLHQLLREFGTLQRGHITKVNVLNAQTQAAIGLSLNSGVDDTAQPHRRFAPGGGHDVGDLPQQILVAPKHEQ